MRKGLHVLDKSGGTGGGGGGGGQRARGGDDAPDVLGLDRSSFAELDLGTLGQLDHGMVALMFRQGVERCLVDCDERPFLEKARRITITLDMLPVVDKAATGRLRCDAVEMAIDVDVKVPKQSIDGHRAKVRMVTREGRAQFVAVFGRDPANPDQMTLPV